jgi:hypothetical protein
LRKLITAFPIINYIVIVEVKNGGKRDNGYACQSDGG